MTQVPPNIQQLREQKKALQFCLNRMKHSTITQTTKDLADTTNKLLAAEAEAEKLAKAKRCNHYHGLET